MQAGLLEPKLGELRLLNRLLKDVKRGSSEEAHEKPRRNRAHLACRAAALLAGIQSLIDAIDHALLAARMTTRQEDRALHLLRG